ncbi:hypothetical protein DEI99_002410 [Curtobacterium sp. MCLR17_036]|uniref:hypothetical protein n=1 Tax=Curtobacterium sp. MCLR17_036 TaxID=2175620 RepID=UPI0011B6EBBC|nr:hypothetical protein [Curtobacterium sp. MCLR17_036]WIE65406.1 hypothetical protein DEI99_002410 [Curtobacterium sp. MCLR17_036]
MDGGASWTRVGLGDETGALLALRADSAGTSVLVGSGPACSTTVLSSTNGGADWHDGATGAAGAGIGPDGLVLASGTAAVPCPDPEQAFQGERTTAVVCNGGLEWRGASGADWVSVPVRGVRSLAVDGTSYTLARSGASDCSGVQIASMPATGLTASVTVTPVGCAADAEDDAALVVARAGAAVWLWAGDDVVVSEDGGVTW